MITQNKGTGVLVKIVNAQTGGKFQTFDSVDYPNMGALGRAVELAKDQWARVFPDKIFASVMTPKYHK